MFTGAGLGASNMAASTLTYDPTWRLWIQVRGVEAPSLHAHTLCKRNLSFLHEDKKRAGPCRWGLVTLGRLSGDGNQRERRWDSLCVAEGHLEVVAAVGGAQGIEVEGVGEEVVHQGAEGHAVAPAGREVLDAHGLGATSTREEDDFSLLTMREGWRMELGRVIQ